MKHKSELLWSLVAVFAMSVSFWMLYREMATTPMAEIIDALKAIPGSRLLAASFCCACAYIALACYDHIGLLHLGKRLNFIFITLVSFTSYALSHNIGLNMIASGIVRYRAYSTKGVTAAEVAILVLFCSFTFALGAVLLGGIILLIDPMILARLFAVPPIVVRLIGLGLLGLVGLYAAGSLLHFKPLRLFGFTLVYPRPNIVFRQLFAAPIELMGAAGILYFALPESSHLDFITVLGVFLASFSAGLLSHAPGGLGVFEAVFLKATPEVPHATVMAALIVFRLFYLVLPLFISVMAIIGFQRSRLKSAALDATASVAERDLYQTKNDQKISSQLPSSVL